RARAELPLDELDPRLGQLPDRAQPRAEAEEPLRRPRGGRGGSRARRPARGGGEPVRVLEVEDEHAEARFVAAEIAMLVEEDYSGSEIAVFYRTNAQSRGLEDGLVRTGVAYEVFGGP